MQKGWKKRKGKDEEQSKEIQGSDSDLRLKFKTLTIAKALKNNHKSKDFVINLVRNIYFLLIKRGDQLVFQQKSIYPSIHFLDLLYPILGLGGWEGCSLFQLTLGKRQFKTWTGPIRNDQQIFIPPPLAVGSVLHCLNNKIHIERQIHPSVLFTWSICRSNRHENQ